MFTDYPIHLGLAYLFLVGYLVRTIFVKLRLPGAVGVIVSGFAFSFFMQPEILQGRDHLQGLAFFLVLLTAGMEISIGDLRPHIIVSAVVPASFELAGISAYARHVLGWSWVESAVLGITLFGLGDGLVIPKMGDFAQRFPGNVLPRTMFLWAPLEASFALTMFGIMSGLADPAGKDTASVPVLVIANVLRLGATVLVGSLAGAATGWLVTNRSSLPVPLTGTTVEAYLFVLAVALAGFGMSSEETGFPLVPMGFTSGSLFQPELMVIVIGSLFARVVDTEVLHNVEMTMGGVWVFGQIVLFSMLGSRTDLSLFAQLRHVLPILAVGLPLRFLGVLIVTATSPRSRRSVFTDATFYFLATLPRATLQGALGGVPITQRFFHKDGNRLHVQLFISMAARLYIVCMSILGSILLDFFGPMMLAAHQQANDYEKMNDVHGVQEPEHLERRLNPELNPEKPSHMLLRHKSVEEFPSELPDDGASTCGAETPGATGPMELQRATSKELLPRVPESIPDQLTLRMAAWSTLHQLEGRMVEEPPPDIDAEAPPPPPESAQQEDKIVEEHIVEEPAEAEKPKEDSASASTQDQAPGEKACDEPKAATEP